MAYVKQTWSCGDEISAEKLNHMEDGIYDASQSGGGNTPLLVNAISAGYGRYDLDKTFGEIRNAYSNGRMVVVTRVSSDTTTHSAVQEVETLIDSESYAQGTVSTYNGAYSVSVTEAPYTLEALDAQYPFISD